MRARPLALLQAGEVACQGRVVSGPWREGSTGLQLGRRCPAPGSGCPWGSEVVASPGGPRSPAADHALAPAIDLQFEAPDRPASTWKCPWLWLPGDAP